jgi:hypothetical protein
MAQLRSEQPPAALLVAGGKFEGAPLDQLETIDLAEAWRTISSRDAALEIHEERGRRERSERARRLRLMRRQRRWNSGW